MHIVHAVLPPHAKATALCGEVAGLPSEWPEDHGFECYMRPLDMFTCSHCRHMAEALQAADRLEKEGPPQECAA